MENVNPYTLSSQDCLKQGNIQKEVNGHAITWFHIGKGGQSEVLLAVNRQTGEKVAVKVIRKDQLTKRGKDNLEREIEIHRYISSFQNPYICNLYSTSEDESYYYMFLEFLESDLVSYIEQQGTLTEDEVREIFNCVMESVSFLHTYSIVHRDIKAENFLITCNDSGKIDKIKLTDFGLAQWSYTDKLFESFCGSPSYTAPEIIDKKGYTGEPTDIWSSGILLYVLLFSKFPFHHSNLILLFKQVANAKIELPHPISAEAEELLKRMLERNVEQRLTAKEVLDHPWLSSHSYKSKIDWL